MQGVRRLRRMVVARPGPTQLISLVGAIVTTAINSAKKNCPSEPLDLAFMDTVNLEE